MVELRCTYDPQTRGGDAPDGRKVKATLHWVAAPGTRYRFERLGYFCVGTDTAPGKPVYNRTVTLRDTGAKIEKRGG